MTLKVSACLFWAIRFTNRKRPFRLLRQSQRSSLVRPKWLRHMLFYNRHSNVYKFAGETKFGSPESPWFGIKWWAPIFWCPRSVSKSNTWLLNRSQLSISWDLKTRRWAKSPLSNLGLSPLQSRYTIQVMCHFLGLKTLHIHIHHHQAPPGQRPRPQAAEARTGPHGAPLAVSQGVALVRALGGSGLWPYRPNLGQHIFVFWPKLNLVKKNGQWFWMFLVCMFLQFFFLAGGRKIPPGFRQFNEKRQAMLNANFANPKQENL